MTKLPFPVLLLVVFFFFGKIAKGERNILGRRDIMQVCYRKTIAKASFVTISFSLSSPHPFLTCQGKDKKKKKRKKEKKKKKLSNFNDPRYKILLLGSYSPSVPRMRRLT